MHELVVVFSAILCKVIDVTTCEMVYSGEKWKCDRFVEAYEGGWLDTFLAMEGV